MQALSTNRLNNQAFPIKVFDPRKSAIDQSQLWWLMTNIHIIDNRKPKLPQHRLNGIRIYSSDGWIAKKPI